MRNERNKNSELKFKKFQIARINNPSQIIGGDGDEGDNQISVLIPTFNNN